MKNDKITDRTLSGKTGISCVKLIPDAPTTQDSFGAHDLLADAIAETIQKELGGKAIALEGGWGSGKSSIVEMLRKRFGERTVDSEEDDVHVFLFDAWSHEGDPLRRVFLEELLSFCRPKLAPVESGKWSKRERTEITGSSKTIKQKSTPVLRSSWPLLIVGLLSMFPVAVAAVGGLFRQNLADPLIWRLLITSLLIASIVPVGAFALFVYCAWPVPPFSRWKWFNPATPRDKRRENAGRLISLYAKKVDENIETTAHESQGPTSIEFQRYFAGLMKAYLSDPRRRFLIVLDNLDRIPTSSAKALWATLRVFADCCEDPRNSDWSSRVWFLVPYDPVSASRLWDDGEELSEDPPSAGAAKTREGGSSNSLTDDRDTPTAPTPPRLSSAFLDKTFQVRFDVPPLLLSDWKQYLATQLQQCLGTELATDSEVHIVYLLSRRMSEAKRRPPTPRHLKLFSNDIVALCRRFKQAFPISTLALYAMLRRQGHDVRLWLLEKKDEHRQFESLFGGNDFQAALCAMAHGITDIEKARDLHLRAPIESAIASGDAPALAELSSSYGFWQVIEILCDDPVEQFGSDQERVLNALTAIEESKVLENTAPEVGSIKRFIERLVVAADWGTLADENAVGFIRASRIGVHSESLRTQLSKLARLAEADSSDAFEPEKWVSGLGKIASFLESLGRLDEFERTVVIPAAIAGQVLEALGTLSDSDLHTNARLIKLESSKDVVANFLPDNASIWDETKAQSLRAAIEIVEQDIDGTGVSKSLQSRLSVDEELKKLEIERIVSALDQLETHADTAVSDALKQMAENGVLFRRVKNCERSLETATVGRLFRWIVRFGSLGTPPSSPTNAPEGYTLVIGVATAPNEHSTVIAEIVSHCQVNDEYGMLDATLIEVGNAPKLAAAVISELKKEGKLGAVLVPELYCDRFDGLCKLADDEPENSPREFAKSLLKHPEFVASLEQLAVSDESTLAIAELVGAGAARENDIFKASIQNWIEGRTADEWIASLKNGDGAAKLTISYKNSVPDFELAGELAQAVESILSDIVEGNESASVIGDDWHSMVEIVPHSRQQTLAGRVIERSDRPDSNLSGVIPLLTEPMAEAAAEYDDSSFLRNAILPLVEKRESGGLAWLEQVVIRGLQCWNASSEDDRATFADELSSVYQTSDDELQGKILVIADRLDIQLVTEETANDLEENER